jgi:hypothetical protein
LVTAGKQVNIIRVIARQQPVSVEKLFKAVFSVDPPRGYMYNEEPMSAELEMSEFSWQDIFAGQ